ncbi:MAG: RDD family protein [Propionicimonas sp.]
MTAPVRPRLLAGLIDSALVLAWAALVGVVGLALSWSGVLVGYGPLAVNLAGLLTIVVPVVLGLTLAESGRYEATPGKLRLGLRVRTEAGGRVSRARSLLRNLLKVGLPWTLLHLGAISVAAGGGWDAQLGAVLALLVLVAYLVSLLRGTGRTIYDQLSGTTVIAIAAGRRFATDGE